MPARIINLQERERSAPEIALGAASCSSSRSCFGDSALGMSSTGCCADCSCHDAQQASLKRVLSTDLPPSLTATIHTARPQAFHHPGSAAVSHHHHHRRTKTALLSFHHPNAASERYCHPARRNGFDADDSDSVKSNPYARACCYYVCS